MRAVPGAYEELVHFARPTIVTKAAAAAHASYTMGADPRKVSFVNKVANPTDYMDTKTLEGTFYNDVILAGRRHATTKRPYNGTAVPRHCVPVVVPRSKPRIVYSHKGLKGALAAAPPPADAPADVDGDVEADLERRFWPREKPGAKWPPAKRRFAGTKTRARQRQFGSAPRLELVDGLRIAGRLRCAEGPGPCAYDPVDPDRPSITREAKRSLNVSCGYKAPAPEPKSKGAAAAPAPALDPEVEVPRSLLDFPRPPDWLAYHSPVARRLAMSRKDAAARATSSRQGRRSFRGPATTAAAYSLPSPLAARTSVAPGPAPPFADDTASEADFYEDDGDLYESGDDPGAAPEGAAAEG